MKLKCEFLLLYVFYILILPNTVSAQPSVEIMAKRNSNGTFTFTYLKNVPGNYFVGVDFSNLQNALDPKFTKVVNKKRGTLFSLKPINFSVGISFGEYKTHYAKGNPFAIIDSTFVYAVPFVAQSNVVLAPLKLDTANKDTEEGKKSIGFLSDDKRITAVRRGTVTDITLIEQDFEDDRFEIKDAIVNVLVEHQDGSYARYSGLGAGTLHVEINDEVLPADAIGNSAVRFNNKWHLNMLFFVYRQSSIEQPYVFDSVPLVPSLLLENGILRVANQISFKTPEISEATRFKELSKKEKKRFLNGKN